MSWIHDEIEAVGGEVPFETFMELALYHPEHGYYSGPDPRFGRKGDYLTAPTASPWYGRAVARLLTAVAASGGPLRLLDLGSGDGSFLATVIEATTGNVDVLAETVSIERSHAMLELQRERWSGFTPSVRVFGSLDAIPRSNLPTVVHASELYDAQPVARAVGRANGMAEMWVETSANELRWREHPPRTEVAAYFDRHGVELEEGQIGEANLQAESTHRHILRVAGDSGLVVVLDYGYRAARLYDPRARRFGSLTTFHRHQIGRDPLREPGKVDLTAHVNWSDLRRSAELEDWAEIGLWPLAELLVRAGLAEVLDEAGHGMAAQLDAETVSVRQEVKRLLDPDGMGSDLKMLVQAKGDLFEPARAALELNSEFGIPLTHPE
jgi:SAM-dependent MidA family methyltransferase